jgi:hypothetical protein
MTDEPTEQRTHDLFAAWLDEPPASLVCLISRRLTPESLDATAASICEAFLGWSSRHICATGRRIQNLSKSGFEA